MPELTPNEAAVLGVVRHETRLGDPVRSADVQHRASGRGVAYEATTRALRSLLDQGLLTKPSRGFYLPTREETACDSVS